MKGTKCFIKGVLSVPIYISHFFQSLVGTLLGVFCSFIFCGIPFPWIITMLSKNLYFRIGSPILQPEYWFIVQIVIELYCFYVMIGTLITIFPFFSYKGKLNRLREGV